MESYKLNDGRQIPVLGFGTWKAKDGEEAYQAVKTALEVGYRHIDTAAIYQNEESVGKAIRDSGIPREELFVTTKLWNNRHTYEDAVNGLEESLHKLGLEYIDLYLIHWPNPVTHRENEAWKERNREVWRAMEDMQAEGKIRSIGVSNFLPHHLDALLESAKVLPAVNQIRLAPGVYQEEVVRYCRDKGILLEAWGPFGQGELFQNETVLALAKKYSVTPAQLLLAWSLAEEFLPLPKSVTPERIASNLQCTTIELAPEDCELLRKIPVEAGAPDPDTKDF